MNWFTRPLLFLAAVVPSIVLAQSFTTTISGSTGVGATGCAFDQSGIGAISNACATYGPIDTPMASAAIASAGRGYLQLSASVSANAIPSPSVGSGRAAASFSDSLSFFAPGLTNQTATFYGAVVVEGSLSADALATHVGDGAGISGANASWAASGGFLGVGFVGQGTTEAYSDERPRYSSNITGSLLPTIATLSFDSTGHASGNLSMTASVSASAAAFGFRQTSQSVVEPGQAGASASFGNTIYWSGISQVTVNGNAFNGDYAVTSLSGADYRFSTQPASPVPEPMTLAMLVAGLFALAGVRRGSLRTAHLSSVRALDLPYALGPQSIAA